MSLFGGLFAGGDAIGSGSGGLFGERVDKGRRVARIGGGGAADGVLDGRRGGLGGAGGEGQRGAWELAAVGGVADLDTMGAPGRERGGEAEGGCVKGVVEADEKEIPLRLDLRGGRVPSVSPKTFLSL